MTVLSTSTQFVLLMGQVAQGLFVEAAIVARKARLRHSGLHHPLLE